MTSNQEKNTTDFGYQKVPLEKKSALVAEVFHSVAPQYDLMNDLMSFGLHRLWKCFAINETNVKKGHRILDIASGTGDLVKTFAKKVGKYGQVIMTDINKSMLFLGRDRLINENYLNNIYYVQADAENLPFQSSYFDRLSIAFGLRNLTDKDFALKEMYRVLKPATALTILEFSQPSLPILKSFYDFYSFKIIPPLGEMVAKDRASYEYLVESIRKHESPELIENKMKMAGFEGVHHFKLTGGIVVLHKGYKY